MKVVLAEKVSPATLAVFQSEPGWQVLTHDQIKDQVKNLPEALADADALVVRSAVQVDDALMAAAPKLRVIGRAGVGVDNIDAEAATRRGIVVMNTPGANAIAVAELTLGLMIALARQLPRADSTMHAGKWEKKSLQGAELRGKKLGILGLGRIGLEVARRARQFGMELLGHDPFVSASIARENAIRLVSAEELFAMSDYLTLHVGLTPQTTGIINAATLATMKKGVRIVNCARGELVVEADLAEAQEAVGVQIALQVREYLKSGIAQNAVNLPSLSHEEYQEIAPWMILAERLGTFLAQIPRGSIDSIQLSYHGRLAETKTELIRNSAIAGVLGHLEQVNRINAASVAQERGIRLHEEKMEEARGAAGSVLELRLHTSETSMSASGAVLHGDSPRLLHLDGIDIEAPLQGTLITIRNKDVPGVIGRIGTILGEHHVNIANFALGRANGTGSEPVSALAVVQVDGVVTDEVLRELRAVPAITGVRLVTL